MEKALIVNTQYLENYDLDGGNAWKFKGGKEYVISFGVTKEIYEEKSLPKLDTQQNLKIDEAETSRNCFRPEPPAASFSRLTL